MGKNYIEPLNDLGMTNEADYISDMYYSKGAFSFAISKDKKHMVLNMFLGPRYGSGWSYDIELCDSGYILINKTMLWVS